MIHAFIIINKYAHGMKSFGAGTATQGAPINWTRKILVGAMVSLIGLCAFGPQPASAALLNFQTSGALGLVDPANPGIGASGFVFLFNDVQFSVDTITGLASLSGLTTHQASGDVWRMSATYSGLRTKGGWNTTSVPYDNMFNDLRSAGSGGPDVHGHPTNALVWGSAAPGGITAENTLQIDPVTLNPTYGGPRQFIGKADSLGSPFLIGVWDPYVGTQWSLVGFGWLSPGDGSWAGDYSFAICERPPVIPEPSTGALLGLGLVGGLLRRKRRV